MRFLIPSNLLFLAPWFLVILVWLFIERKKQQKLEQFATTDALNFLLKGTVGGLAGLKQARIRKFFLRWLAGAFVVIALARPQLGSHTESVKTQGLDVVFALDVSRSMLVEDVVPSRIKKAKHVIRSFLDRLGGDRVGVVIFAGSAYPAVPLTTDFDFIMQTLETVDERSIPNQGSDLSLGLNQAMRLITNGGLNEKTEATDTGNANRVVVVLSDGEDHEGAESKTAENLSKEGIRVYSIGIGSVRGGPIPLRDEHGVLRGYKKDSSGNIVQSKLETANLEGVAKKTGGRYYNVSVNEGEIDDILSDLSGSGSESGVYRQIVVYQELFQVPLGIAIVLLLAQALWQIRRVPVQAVFFAVAIAGGANASATTLREYGETKKGIEAYSKKDFSGAIEHFTKAQAASPQTDVQHLNLGDALLQANDLDGAAREFHALTDSADANFAAKGAYNLGKTYEKKKDLEKAMQSYQKGLNRLREAEKPDPEAMLRLKRALEQAQQQQQQQKQDGNGQGDDGQDGQSGESDKQQNSEKDEDDQKGQKKKIDENSVGKKQKFKGEKLSEADARQLLERLQDQEKKSQQRLMRGKMEKSKEQSSKDW